MELRVRVRVWARARVLPGPRRWGVMADVAASAW